MIVFGMRTSNPAFSSYFWGKKKSCSSAKMSLSGIIFKSFSMLCLVALTASYTWKIFFDGTNIKWHTTIGMFVAIIASLFISFKHDLAKWLLPIYALAKGFFLGGISAYAHKKFPDLPLQAVAVTLTTFFVMLILFKTKLIVVTQKLKAIIITATITIFSIYIFSRILSYFGINLGIIYGTSNLAIAFNCIAAIVASFSLLLDFYYTDKQIGKAPKEREWLATWGFLITLIWLYVEVLRLMKKLVIRF